MLYLVGFLLVLGLGPVILYIHTDVFFYIGATAIGLFDLGLILLALGSKKTTQRMIAITEARYATVRRARRAWKVQSALYVLIALVLYTWPASLYLKGLQDAGVAVIGFVSLSLSIAPMLILYLRLLKISR